MDLKRVYIKIGSWQGIFLIIFSLFFLSAYTIKWTPNLHYENQTTIDGLTEQKEMIFYGKADSVPVKNIGDNDFNHWGMEQVFVYIAVLILYIILGNIKNDDSAVKTIEEICEIVTEDLRKMKRISKFNVFYSSINLQYIKVDETRPEPYKYYAFAEVEFNEEAEGEQGHTFIGFKINPLSGRIEARLETKDKPNSSFICPNCGAGADFKERTSAGFKELNNKWKTGNK